MMQLLRIPVLIQFNYNFLSFWIGAHFFVAYDKITMKSKKKQLNNI